jgi:dTDP-4-dehydrorhamnose reductase
MAVNGTGARILAEATAEFGAHLVHLSTDYVFSGDLTRPYTEVDATGPINVYGSAKLAGELAVLAILPTATIVRTSWVSGYHGANIVKTTLHLADRAENLLFVDDQWGSPTFAEDLAPLLRQLGVDRVTGIVHATNQGEVTWFGLAREILSAAGLDPKRVQPVSSDTLAPQRPARRPANSRLENARLRSLGIPPLPPFEESLAVLVRRLRES